MDRYIFINVLKQYGLDTSNLQIDQAEQMLNQIIEADCKSSYREGYINGQRDGYNEGYFNRLTEID